MENKIKEQYLIYMHDPDLLPEFIEAITPFITKDVSKYTAMAICDLIDDIELDCKNTSMEEWKMFKRIRNTIREKLKIL